MGYQTVQPRSELFYSRTRTVNVRIVRWMIVALLVASCSGVPGRSSEPPPAISETMSGEPLVLADAFLDCMAAQQVEVFEVAVEISDTHDVVTDLSYKVEGSLPPSDRIVDGCFVYISDMLDARRP